MHKLLSQLLKNSRLRAGLTQAQAAQALGYSTPQFISNWERGISCPPRESLVSLIHLYQLDRDRLIEIILADMREKLERAIPEQTSNYKVARETKKAA